MSKILKLIEKASIDWNNYLTKDEVKQFLAKDDKIESAENIIYSKEFEPRYKDFHNDLNKKYNNSWTKKELVQDLANFYYNGHLIESTLNEGIHLVAYVRSKYEPGVKTMEDNDYNSKNDFAKDLRANEYTVLSINDNRDLYVADHSDFGNLAQLKKKMLFYKQMSDDAKSRNPDSTLFEDDYKELKKMYDEAMSQSLN